MSVVAITRCLLTSVEAGGFSPASEKFPGRRAASRANGPVAREITTEAASAVIMDSSLLRVDELFHIARRMRRIALQSAAGGMALSVVGMLIAFGGFLPPGSGAVFQELIDLAAVLNALRAAVPGGALSDYQAAA